MGGAGEAFPICPGALLFQILSWQTPCAASDTRITVPPVESSTRTSPRQRYRGKGVLGDLAKIFKWEADLT